MPHPFTLRCRSCRGPLATSTGGSLSPLVPVERIRRDGAVILVCLCGERRVWGPAYMIQMAVIS